MSQGNSQGDHQEPTLPPLTVNRSTGESADAMRVDEVAQVHNLGKEIQAARTAKNMTAADLAQSLNLDLRIVEAIEANRFENAPEPIYVRAYLKHWAGLLGVDAKVWINAYNAHNAIEPEQDPRKMGAHPPLEVMTPRKANRSVHGAKSGSRLWRGLAALFLVVAVAAVILFSMPATWQHWVSARLGGNVPSDTTGNQPIKLMPLAPPKNGDNEASVTVPPAGSAAPVRPQQETPSSPDSTSPPPETTEPTTPAKLLPALPQPVTDAPTVDQNASTAEPSSSPAPASADAATTVNAPPEGAVSAQGSAAQVASDLVIKATSADCWVEVRNAAGKRLVYDVLKNGETRRIPGTGPFTVVLGNPSAVEVLWKGAPVKLGAPNATTGVVRTTIGG